MTGIMHGAVSAASLLAAKPPQKVFYRNRPEGRGIRPLARYARNDLLPTLKGWGFLREGHAVMLLLPFNVGNQGVEVIVADGNGEPARRPEMAPGIA